MAVPTDATKVYTGSLANPSVSIDTGFVPDLAFSKTRNSTSPIYTGTRLQGNSVALITSNTTSEGGFGWQWDRATNTFMQTSLGSPVIDWIFARAPSVMDVVCYTGTGSATTQAHNLAAVPELMIFKRRSASASWGVYCNKYNGGVNANQYYQILNQPDAESSGSGLLNNTNPTLSLFTVGTWNENNASGSTYVAYLFATCAGVSKVGSYTGTGATQTISCGFTGGARWVMVKRTDSTGDWYVWDTARGMVVGTDPSLLLNANASEVNANSIYTATGGFQIVSTAAGINASGGSYIFLAIA